MAANLIDAVSGELLADKLEPGKNPAAVALGRLSELAVGGDYGAATPAPRRSALRASHGPSICRAVTCLAMPW